jgi:hypothetical protein
MWANEAKEKSKKEKEISLAPHLFNKRCGGCFAEAR